MDGLFTRQMAGWMIGWSWMDRKDGWRDGWIDRQIDGWMLTDRLDEWTDEWMDG